MMGKSWSLFIKEYNQRLLNWLVVFSLVMVVVGRFIIKFILIEMAAWILFIFLETYTRMFRSAESLYYNPVWHFVVATWETLVYSPILDLDRWAIPIGCIVALWMFYWRCYEGNMDRGVFYLCTMVIRVVQIDQYLINGEASVPFGILLINHLGRTFPFFNR
ncbi:uncharacterized protein LOC111283284 [Durio zibethinus]|uniref:Uncharacterized protein LOC111283284 n=1 Tax=Durio zibethinus TaxID=66656 RepID=A0A6P5XHY0_DURZI|nr:uncharacterized protein LOC111283284 [Durio zibethinus]